MRKSFILHIDSLGILDELTDEQAGQLFKLIHEYHNPNKPKQTQITQLVNLAFYNFKAQFERDLQTYNNVVERNKNNGLLGGRPKKENPKKPKKADSDSKSDSDSKNDNTSLKKKQKKKFVFGDEHKNYLSWFNKVTGKGIKSFNQTDVNNFEQLKELKYTGKDHNDAVKMLMVNEWAKENGAVSPSHFLRKDNFERYLQQSQAGGKEVCPYNEEQLKLANKYLESGGTPDWFDKKWIYKLPSYGTKHY